MKWLQKILDAVFFSSAISLGFVTVITNFLTNLAPSIFQSWLDSENPSKKNILLIILIGSLLISVILSILLKMQEDRKSSANQSTSQQNLLIDLLISFAKRFGIAVIILVVLISLLFARNLFSQLTFTSRPSIEQTLQHTGSQIPKQPSSVQPTLHQTSSPVVKSSVSQRRSTSSSVGKKNSSVRITVVNITVILFLLLLALFAFRMTPNELENLNIYRSDPIAYFLIQKLYLSPLSFSLLSILITTGLLLLTAWLSDTMWSKIGQVGLLQDWIPWVLAILINPVILAYYLWSFKAINNIINYLEASDIVEIDTENEQIAATVYRRRWRNLLSLSSAVSISIFVSATLPLFKNSWIGSGLLPNLSITVLTWIFAYMVTMLVSNFIANIQILNFILKDKQFNINLLHPDRCGGLRYLSDYSLKTAYFMAALGIWIGIVAYQVITQGIGQNYWFISFIFLLYLLLSTSCFFCPLLAAHRGMERAKNELLSKIARQFQQDYFQTQSSLNVDAATLRRKTEKIRELREFYTITNEFPNWPFDIATFRLYLLTVPAPLLVPLIGLLQKNLETLLKQ
ncbi:MAG: hypothetical protein RM347_012560 [Nostoc sp. ChiQUE02]|uniref:hypothetical protein n=1 Tax=Nostoc sp. ChiQUE02 TaxID=3075377 RepID=UPI002AD499AC|nr:hypothetical protein [Nostoc sp. ChiQUE02]MDZ8229470.1 hypothetical protein [Nostoc sp. ChiQUE02]